MSDTRDPGPIHGTQDRDLSPGTLHPGPQTRDLYVGHRTWDPPSGTRDPKPYTWEPGPKTFTWNAGPIGTLRSIQLSLNVQLSAVA